MTVCNHFVVEITAIILALQILKREKSVKLAVFVEEGIQIVSLERNFTNIDEAEFQLRVGFWDYFIIIFIIIFLPTYI